MSGASCRAAVAAVMAENYPSLPKAWAEAYTWTKKRIKLSSVDAERRPTARNMDKVRAIAEKRRAGDALPPIIVIEEGDGKRCMVDGYHRWLGCKQAGDRVILAYVGVPAWKELYQPGGDAYEQEKLTKGFLTYDELKQVGAARGTKTLAELVEESLKRWTDKLLAGRVTKKKSKRPATVVTDVLHVPTEDDAIEHVTVAAKGTAPNWTGVVGISKGLNEPEGKPLLEIIDLRRKTAKAALTRRMKGTNTRTSAKGKNFPRRPGADKPASRGQGRKADGKDLSKALTVEITRL